MTSPKDARCLWPSSPSRGAPEQQQVQCKAEASPQGQETLGQGQGVSSPPAEGSSRPEGLPGGRRGACGCL